MNLAFLPLFTPFMSAGPGSLVGLFWVCSLWTAMKGVGGTRDLKSLNEGRQATLLSSLFWSCVQPKASNGLWHLALLQTWVCVCECWCVASAASACLASALYDFFLFFFFFFSFHISAFISHFLTSSACLSGLGVFGVSGQLETYLRVRWGFKWEAERKRMMCWAAVSRTGSLPAGVWPWPAVSVRSRSRSAEGKPRGGNK